jgi:hypothetical protein
METVCVPIVQIIGFAKVVVEPLNLAASCAAETDLTLQIELGRLRAPIEEMNKHSRFH